MLNASQETNVLTCVLVAVLIVENDTEEVARARTRWCMRLLVETSNERRARAKEHGMFLDRLQKAGVTFDKKRVQVFRDRWIEANLVLRGIDDVAGDALKRLMFQTGGRYEALADCGLVVGCCMAHRLYGLVAAYHLDVYERAIMDSAVREVAHSGRRTLPSLATAVSLWMNDTPKDARDRWGRCVQAVRDTMGGNSVVMEQHQGFMEDMQSKRVRFRGESKPVRERFIAEYRTMIGFTGDASDQCLNWMWDLDAIMGVGPFKGTGKYGLGEKLRVNGRCARIWFGLAASRVWREIVAYRMGLYHKALKQEIVHQPL